MFKKILFSPKAMIPDLSLKPTYLNKEYLAGPSKAPAISTATTSPQMAIIPAITTGIIDFIISSGLITDMAAIPVPDFAVPQAAPSAEKTKQKYKKETQGNHMRSG